MKADRAELEERRGRGDEALEGEQFDMHDISGGEAGAGSLKPPRFTNPSPSSADVSTSGAPRLVGPDPRCMG